MSSSLRQEVHAAFTFQVRCIAPFRKVATGDLSAVQDSVIIDVIFEAPLYENDEDTNNFILNKILPLITDQYALETLRLSKPVLQSYSLVDLLSSDISLSKELTCFKFIEEGALYSDEVTWKEGVIPQLNTSVEEDMSMYPSV